MAIKAVITGSPGSGKSSLIKSIDKKGYRTYMEVARGILNMERQKGVFNPHKEDRKRFLERVWNIQYINELESENELIVFLDRSLVDTIAYYKFGSLEPPYELVTLARNRYDFIFYLNILPQSQLINRQLDDKERITIDKILKKEYESLDYSPFYLEVMPIEERLNIVLKEIGLK